MALNPWRVQSIDEFNFFCCPECVYRSKEENSFQTHALQNHELSSTFFHHADDPKTIETGINNLIDRPSSSCDFCKILSHTCLANGSLMNLLMTFIT